MSCKVGTVAANTGSVTTTVTGLGFQPEALIVWATQNISDSQSPSAASGGWSLGFSDGTHHVSTACGVTNSHASTSQMGKQYSTTKVVAIITDGVPTVANQATVAFTADGFTLTWDSTPGSAYEIGYMAIGGALITNTFVGSDTVPLTAISKSYTGVGFKGDFVMLLGSAMTAAGTSSNLNANMGFATATNKTRTYVAGTDNSATPNVSTYVSTAGCFGSIISGTSSATSLATFTSFDADGFTLNFTTVDGVAYGLAYLVIKGGNWDCGTLTSNTGTGNQSVATLSFQPEGLFFNSSTAVTSGIRAASIERSCGGASSTSARSFAGMGVVDNSITNNAKFNYMSTRVTDFMLAATGSTADFVSFDSAGWTINWVEAPPAARLCPWFAFRGDTLSTGDIIALTTQMNLNVH